MDWLDGVLVVRLNGDFGGKITLVLIELLDRVLVDRSNAIVIFFH